MNTNIATLRQLPVEELVKKAFEHGLDNAGNMRRSELVFELVRASVSGSQHRQPTLMVYGVLEILADGFGFLRSELSAYAPGADDIYVSPSQIRRFNLRSGDHLEGKGRAPRDGERYIALLQIQKINGQSPEGERNRLHFDSKSTALPEIELWPEAVKHNQSSSSDDPSHPSDPFLVSICEHLRIKVGARTVFMGGAFHDSADEMFSLVTALKPSACVVFAPSLSSEQSQLLHQRLGINSTPAGSTPQLFTTSPFEEPHRSRELLELAINRAKRLAERGEEAHFLISDLNAVLLDSKDLIGQSAPNAVSDQGSASVIPKSTGESVATRFAQKVLAQSRSFESGGSLNIWCWASQGRSSFEDTVLNRLQHQGAIEWILMSDDGARQLNQAIRLSNTVHRRALQG